MIVLPSLDETIQSNKSPDEICETLRAVTVSRGEHGYADGRGEFIGKVDTTGFKVISNIRYRNSFLPVITGNIRAEGSRTVIIVKMRMHPLTSVFSVVWLSGVSFFLLIGILVICVDRNVSSLILLCTAGGMMAFGQLLIRGGFYRPARKALGRLRELFGEQQSGSF